MIAGIDSGPVGRRLQQRPSGPMHLVRRREIEKRQIVAALEMLSVLVLWVSVEMTMLERGTALPVDQPGRRIGELGRRIAGRGVTLGLEEQRPARAEAPQHVVEPRRSEELRVGKACVSTCRYRLSPYH